VEVFEPTFTQTSFLSQSQSNVMTDSQLATQSWCQAPSWAQDQIFVQYICMAAGPWYKALARATENTSSCFIVVRCSCCSRLHRKHLFPGFTYCCVASVALVTSCHVTFAGPFSSNGCLCWFHNSDLEPHVTTCWTNTNNLPCNIWRILLKCILK
jgi:hypothetical protein